MDNTEYDFGDLAFSMVGGCASNVGVNGCLRKDDVGLRCVLIVDASVESEKVRCKGNRE